MPEQRDARRVAAATNLDAILDRLEDPRTTASLLNLLDHADTLDGVLTVISTFLAHSDHIIENVRDNVHEVIGLAGSGPIADAVPSAVKLGGQALPLVTKAADADLLAKVGDDEVIGLVATLLDGVKSARAEVASHPVPYGVTKLAGMLRDPEVRRGLEFTLAVVKRLGRDLDHLPPPAGADAASRQTRTGSKEG